MATDRNEMGTAHSTLADFDVDTVWKAPNRSGEAVHIRQCRQLQNADTISEKDADLLHDDLRVCKSCIGPTISPGARCFLCDEQTGGQLHEHIQDEHNVA